MEHDEQRRNDCHECGFTPDACTCAITTVAQLERALDACGPLAELHVVKMAGAWSAIVHNRTRFEQDDPTTYAYSRKSLGSAVSLAFRLFWASKGRH